MTVLRIDHVQLSIPPDGEPAARRFYGELLGLHEVPKPEEMRKRGGMWFAEGIHLGLEPNMKALVKAHPALVVDDLDAVVARLAAAGVAFIEAVDHLPALTRGNPKQPGVRRGHVHDPFGNRIELVAHM